LNRNQFLWNELRGVKNVERQEVGSLLIDDLQTEFEFREMATLNCLKQVAAVKVGSAPLILTASSHNTEAVPRRGLQWNFTKLLSPAALTRRTY